MSKAYTVVLEGLDDSGNWAVGAGENASLKVTLKGKFYFANFDK